MARKRRRSRTLNIDNQMIVSRVLRFYEDDLRTRDVDREQRLQRYAKYRMWTEGKDWPWPDASDIPLPDMQEKSLRLQDTLHNAMMSQRPPINPAALKKNDKAKERTVEDLLDFQFFEECDGERLVGDAADQFVNDPSITVFVPWVKEVREIPQIRIFDPIPEQMGPAQYFETIVRQVFGPVPAEPQGAGWDWKVVRPDGGTTMVRFYTNADDEVEMERRIPTTVHDGPRPQVKEYDDVLYPSRAANLQPPGPGNPNGASHVILRSFPNVDEIRRLHKAGVYDQIAPGDLDQLESIQRSGTDEEEKRQKDDFQGTYDDTHARTHDARSHVKLTRLLCFDRFDIDGDGLDEDVVWWVLKEPKLLLRAERLSVLYPFDPPRRPLAGGSFLPVAGRKDGISLLEQLEGLHDAAKALLDQTIDAGTLANAPIGFYRPSGSLKPETIRLSPGDVYPLGDPSRDIVFPRIGDPQAQAFGINMWSLIQQMEERVSVVGDIQFGRVPPGRSSALRTAGGMALLSGQGEARPERILRRFFSVWVEVWAMMHALDEQFLPKNKEFRIVGYKDEADDPYRTIESADAVRGHFRFTFAANVLNVSRQALQQSLAALMQSYVSALSVQLGILQPDGLYRLLRDVGEAFGQDPDKYLSPPSADALKPKIYAEQAISAILDGTLPDGVPAEPGGAAEHLKKIQAFAQSDELGLVPQEHIGLLRGYTQQVAEDAALQQRRAAAAEAAGAMQGPNQDRGGRPAEGPPASLENPQVQGGELLDETLPSAGGGAIQ